MTGAIAFLAHYVYVLGKLTGKLQACEENITWIRNFLLSKFADVDSYVQHSAVRAKGDVRSELGDWCNELDNIDLPKCDDPYEMAVKLSNRVGIIRLMQKAKEIGMSFSDFLLKSGIYLFEKKRK